MTVLLVAAVGGHLSELFELAPRAGLLDVDHVWVTWRSAQSERLLASEPVIWVPPVAPRDWRATVRVARRLRRVMAEREIDLVVSTGAAIACSALPLAAARGIPAHFIETATRPIGPSMTGRMLRRFPHVQLYTQHPHWAQRPWQYRGSVFDGYTTEPWPKVPVIGESLWPRRVVVTLGTMERYSFRRLVDRIVQILPPGVEVLWQTGCTDTSGTGITGRTWVDSHELRRAMEAADVVIGHCGCGTALGALAAGKVPVLVPRRAKYDEHVDDHQVALGDEFNRRELAVAVDVDDLELEHLERAANRRAMRVPPPPFELSDDRLSRRAVRKSSNGRGVPRVIDLRDAPALGVAQPHSPMDELTSHRQE